MPPKQAHQTTITTTFVPSPPWTPVFSPGTSLPIPNLYQYLTPRQIPVRKTAASPPILKPVRYLLLTTSDGGRLIHDHSGFTEEQLAVYPSGVAAAASVSPSAGGFAAAAAPADSTTSLSSANDDDDEDEYDDNADENDDDGGDGKYTALMAQLGEALCGELAISSSRNKTVSNDRWDVLAQLPLKYNAYYKARQTNAGTTKHADLYIAGHEKGNFDSVKQFGRHLGWLARTGVRGNAGGNAWGTAEGNAGLVGCECKVCTEERKKGVAVRTQAERVQVWAAGAGPVMVGVPEW